MGCWYLAWSVEPAPGTTVGEVPDSVRLREESIMGTRERLVRPATEPTGRSGQGQGETAWEQRFVLNRWWIEGGRLSLRFSDGDRDEWRATLGIEGRELVGAARLRAGRASAEAGIRGSRIDCAFRHRGGGRTVDGRGGCL